MKLVKGSERIIAINNEDPARGHVIWKQAKSVWIGTMTIVAIIGAPLTFSLEALLVFLVLTGATLCAGHSVGMHRRLIHSSFDCSLWLEYFLVWLGTLVGMAGPIGMIRQHDLRDWAQRQPACHDYLCHARGIWQDYFWQCHCDVALENEPEFRLEDRLRNDKVYAWMERTWIWQQLPLALLLLFLGGLPWLIWGVALRVTISVTGHWLVGYFAHHETKHRNDRMSWRVLGASVQGKDVPVAGLISMGESWHNNHHAYPGSAKIGLLPGQPDPGWWFIKFLERLDLAWDIKTPAVMPDREELIRLQNTDTGCTICHLRRHIWRRVFGA